MLRCTLLLLNVSLCAAPLYNVVDLGTLGGGESVAYSVNDSGDAAGWATIGADPHAVSFGPVTILSASARATGINSAGWIAGTVYRDGTSYGTVWTTAGAVDLGSGTYAVAVDDAGQVAGNRDHAFLYSAGTRTDLGVLSGGSWSVAEAMNGAGEVVGYGDTPSGVLAFSWTAANGLIALGGAASYAMGVNNAGTVVGSSGGHAFLWDGGTATDLGTLGGFASYGYGVNDSGVAVGYSWLAGDDETHAWVWRNGVMTDLNTLTPAGSGWDLTAAYGINASGQIVGSGQYGGVSHAFRLDPVRLQSAALAVMAPEPGDWVLFLSGAVLIALQRLTAKSRPEV